MKNSARLIFRLPDDLKQTLEAKAKKEEKTVSKVIRELLTNKIENRELTAA